MMTFVFRIAILILWWSICLKKEGRRWHRWPFQHIHQARTQSLPQRPPWKVNRDESTGTVLAALSLSSPFRFEHCGFQCWINTAKHGTLLWEEYLLRRVALFHVCRDPCKTECLEKPLPHCPHIQNMAPSGPPSSSASTVTRWMSLG